MRVQARPDQLRKRASGYWEVVIGMEIHAQVTSQSKLFSGASTEFGGAPNSHVSLVDAAMPGMLPVINEECVRQAIRTGHGLKARINLKSVFDRKNYFYPDLPQGYQISQYKLPIVGEGQVTIYVPDNKTTSIRIERLHLEQDAGKSLHDRSAANSYVDLNRSGVALMEIVSRPDLRSFDDAMNFMVNVRRILRYLGTCDGDMEKGSLRADVNVSVCRPGEPFGTRCEIKNLNSINFIGQAIECEAERQIEIIEEGGKIEQETRLFDPSKLETRSMRLKEEAHDYRYFPDPDLLPLELDAAYVDSLKKSLPELPDEKSERFIRNYGLPLYQVAVIVADKNIADYYENAVKEAVQRAGIKIPPNVPNQEIARSEPISSIASSTASFTTNELFGRLNKDRLDITDSPIAAWQIGTIVDLTTTKKTISTKIAKELFDILWVERGKDPQEIVETRGMKQVTDTGAIEKIVDDIIAKNPDKVADAKTNPKAIGWFVGQVMKSSGGKASPQTVNDLLKRKLGL